MPSHDIDDAFATVPNQCPCLVFAGAVEVGGRAATLASNLGSFLGSRLSKQKSQLFSPPLLSSLDLPVPTGDDATPAEKQAFIELAEESNPKSSDQTATRAPNRTSFFSAFSNTALPSISAPAELLSRDLGDASTSPLQALVGTSESSSEAQVPPPSSRLGSFFRRSSSSSYILLLPALLGGKSPAASIPSESIPASPTILSQPPPTLPNVILEDKREPPGEAARASQSVDSNRSSIDMMTDVKL